MNKLVKVSDIKSRILEFRGQRVMLDRDLAGIYEVETRALIQAIKRNEERFPRDFVFQLNDQEVDLLVSQNVIPSRKTFGGRNPYVLTRNGANMLSAILRSPIAVERSIQIMRAFSAIEEAISGGKKKLLQGHGILKEISTHSKAIMHLFQKDKLKEKEISKIKQIQSKMITLLQQMVLASMGKD